jgi:hypothetical protein
LFVCIKFAGEDLPQIRLFKTQKEDLNQFLPIIKIHQLLSKFFYNGAVAC